VSASQASSSEATREWPAAGLEPVESCPVCGDERRSVLHTGLTDRAFRAAPGTWTLERCHACSSAYLDPRPTPDTIELAYRAYYTHAGAHAPPPAPGRFRQGLANDYRHARWGYTAGPRVSGGRLIPRVAPLRGALVDREIRHLPALPGGRLLDVGCGSGDFLAQMSALGWRTEGVDPDPAAVAGARAAGLDVTEGTLAELDDAEHAGAFDAITLSHVIEHLHEPAAELRRIRRLLRPGGLLWIATPNLEGLGHRRFRTAWLGLDPPRHLVLFTRPSLEDLLRRIGFAPQPAPLVAPHAFLQLSQSAAIAQGRLPHEGPAHGVLRLRLAAAVADRLAKRDARNADELVTIARRPE
jgi:SAM-dependent methyltransferase